MRRIEALVVVLALALVVESSFLVYPVVLSLGPRPAVHPVGSAESYSFGYSLFNRPVTNNTDNTFKTSYNKSWTITIRSSLQASSRDPQSEAELAFAPAYPIEGKSIPTLIVQERADGLLRVEYFAQEWPNTYGLVLYNSSSAGWMGGDNVTLGFLSLGQPTSIDPQIAPRSNGNLTISVGGQVVFANYPIAWASLDEVYLYGLPGSSFMKGSISVTIQNLSSS